MNYAETVAYLFEQLPLFSRIGAAAYKEDITNTVKLCKAIGDPQEKIKTIHIAGTNGKGSTSHMLAAILQLSGYRTGLYTSPHLKDFRERIRVNGEMISKDFVTRFIDDTRKVSESIEPSFFELTVAMAFQYFYEEGVDIAIIETGLGGRLDSTNIIIPELSIITNIGYDHMNILGDTLELIAAEKAGIIKPGIPVVLGETRDETLHVFEDKAELEKSALLIANNIFEETGVDMEDDQLKVSLLDNHTQESRVYLLDLPGIYQVKNLKTVLTAVKILRKLGYNLPEDKVPVSLATVKKTTGLSGRWEIIQHDPLIVLDVAHNRDGMEQLARQLSSYTFSQLHIVLGMVKDKEVSEILKLLPSNAIYYFTRSRIARALPETELQQYGKLYSLNGSNYPDVNIALSSAMQNATKDDMIVVCGSVFLVGEVNMNINPKA